MKDLLQKASLKKVTNALKDQDYVLGIFLYGSFARGDFGPKSDIDIFIIISNKIYLNKTNDILASLETKRPFARRREFLRVFLLRLPGSPDGSYCFALFRTSHPEGYPIPGAFAPAPCWPVRYTPDPGRPGCT